MSKKKRLFVAVNLPEKARGKLKEIQEQWADFPARWIKPENIHLTLYFLGYVNEDSTSDVVKALENGVRDFGALSFALTRTVYGPPGKYPRMIWVEIGENGELIRLEGSLKKALHTLPFPIHQENRPFNPHLTLCRFNAFDLGHWESDGLPDIDRQIGESVEIRSIELMESKLKRGGAEYSVLQSVKL